MVCVNEVGIRKISRCSELVDMNGCSIIGKLLCKYRILVLFRNKECIFKDSIVKEDEGIIN